MNWEEFIKQELNEDYMKSLSKFITNERLTKKIYPAKENVFNVFKQSFENIKVVIIGQDPYPNEGEAHGYAFSTLNELKTPKSLQIIQKAIEKDIYNGLNVNSRNNLEYLVNQGVFLLNRILTVENKKPLSHKNIGWEIFTNKVIQELDKHKNNLVFLLFGKEAQIIKDLISERHYIIETEHPAASAYAGREWNFNDCFYRCNEFLKSQNLKEIEW
jgi:uracil-DNA glycosylase